MRIVVDTSVVVSAILLPHSIPRRAFDLAADRGSLLVSVATIGELDAVLRRPKFDRYVREELRLEFLAALVQVAEEVVVREAISICRDPKDDKFLELAVSGNATHLITGDADLLELNPFRSTLILTPSNFLAAMDDASKPRVS